MFKEQRGKRLRSSNCKTPFTSHSKEFCFISVGEPLRKKWNKGDFPGGPVVKTSPSNAMGAGSIPGGGAKIPHASQPKNQNIK